MKNLFVLVLLAFVSCKKDEPEPAPVVPPPVQNSEVKLEFVNSVGDEELVFGNKYTTVAGDTFTVSKFNYYISNIAFISNTAYVPVAESYRVVRHPDQRTIPLTTVPSGTYVAMEFLIGVDSARNCSGAQTGGLDPAVNRDMYWDWNTGYIFLKLEGKAPTSGASGQALTYHVGGFKGPNKAMRKVSLDLSAAPVIINKTTSTVKIKADVREMFRGPLDLKFSDFYYQMNPGEGAKKFADNYADMFSVKSVQN